MSSEDDTMNHNNNNNNNHHQKSANDAAMVTANAVATTTAASMNHVTTTCTTDADDDTGVEGGVSFEAADLHKEEEEAVVTQADNDHHHPKETDVKEMERQQRQSIHAYAAASVALGDDYDNDQHNDNENEIVPFPKKTSRDSLLNDNDDSANNHHHDDDDDKAADADANNESFITYSINAHDETTTAAVKQMARQQRLSVHAYAAASAILGEDDIDAGDNDNPNGTLDSNSETDEKDAETTTTKTNSADNERPVTDTIPTSQRTHDIQEDNSTTNEATSTTNHPRAVLGPKGRRGAAAVTTGSLSDVMMVGAYRETPGGISQHISDIRDSEVRREEEAEARMLQSQRQSATAVAISSSNSTIQIMNQQSQSTSSSIRTSNRTSAVAAKSSEFLMRAVPVEEDDETTERILDPPAGMSVAIPVMEEEDAESMRLANNHNKALRRSISSRSQGSMLSISHHHQRRTMGVATCVVILALILGIVLGLLLRNNDNESISSFSSDNITLAPFAISNSSPSLGPSTAAPTDLVSQAMTELLDMLPNSTIDNILHHVDSPQHLAYHWLVDHQNLTALPTWRRVQIFALATFFYAFEGPHWPLPIQNDWLQDSKSECFWFSSEYGRFGVGERYQEVEGEVWNVNPCNAKEEFQYLSLKQLNLTGRHPVLPPEMALLTALSILHLPENNIETPVQNFVPTELALNTKLKVLSVRNNIIQGTIPSQLGLLTNLQFVAFANNELSGSIPTEIGRLSKLTRFYPSNNYQLSGQIPSELGHLTQLSELFLSETALSGSLPSELGQCMELFQFGVTGSWNTGPIPSELFSLPKLKRLWLGDNFLSGSIPTTLGMLGGLEILEFRNASLLGSLPSEIGLLKNLTWLVLNDLSFMSSSIPTELGLLSALEHLDLHNSSFTGSLPSELGLLKNMTRLVLPNMTLLSGSIPAEMENMTSLKYMDISESLGLTGVIPEGLCFLQNESCVYLPWGNCSLVMDCGIQKLCGCDCPC